MKNKKNIGIKVLLACLFATSLSGCSLFKNNKNIEKNKDKEVKTSQKISYQAKKTSVKKDKTTEVLVDSEIKKDDIVKIVKHGDHWHVFTKDGREKITYTDPEQMKDTGKFEMVSVVGKNQLKNKNVVAIKKHGDHYHVYLADGSEYLTYEDPSALFPNIKIGTYVGSHGQKNVNKTKAQKVAENKKVKGKLEKDDERVIKILKHGDHYHIYTSKGNEFVTYEDPRSLYPNASYGIYQGSHGDRKKIIAQILKEDKEKQDKKKAAGIKDEKENSDKLLVADKLVKVEENNKTHNVVSILKHDDHYHIYTADGQEYISYGDPSSLYPDVPIGTYVGSHGDEKEEQTKDKNKSKTEENIRPGKTNDKESNKLSSIENLKITNILGKEKVNRHDIVKILKHDDHYHIYDSKGNEGVTHVNPQDLYPEADFGQYEGSHGDENKNKDEFKWPEGITRIVDHRDHWHLYRGDDEVAVVHVDPKDRYPEAEYIKDYVDVGNVEVGEKDLFTYESVPAKKVDGIEAVLNDNLREMTGYGKLTDGIEIFGTNDKDGEVFYWLHGNHYHALSIKDLVKMEKAGAFKGYTARDIVATLKYKIANPKTDLSYKSDLSIDEIKDFLKSYYKISEKSRFYILGVENIYIHTGVDTNNFHISEFEKKDGKISYKGDLPKILSDEELEKKEEEKEKEEKQDKEDHNKTEEEPSKENSNNGKDDKSEDEKTEKEGEKSPENKEEKVESPGEKENKDDEKENPGNNDDGYATSDDAEKAAKEALKNGFGSNAYKISRGTNGKWFYTLKYVLN